LSTKPSSLTGKEGESREEIEKEKNGKETRDKGQLLLLLIYFDLFTIAIYISSFSVYPFPLFFAMENSEKRAQSNKIKLGFIDPFQFESLMCHATPLPCQSTSPLSFYSICRFALVQQLN